MKKILVALLMVLTLGLTACGEPASSPEEKNGSLDGGYVVGTVTIDGKDITCVTMERDAGQSKWGGISCDWVAYHGLDRKPVE
jgi:hypothetical protein